MLSKTAVNLGLILILVPQFAPADEVQDQFSVASAHYSAQRWNLAIDEFQSIVKRFPDHERAIDARFYVLESLTQLKQYADAERIAIQFYTDFPEHSFAAQVLYRWAELAMLQGDDPQALKLFNQFNQRFPTHELGQYVLTYLGRLAERQHDYDESNRFLKQSLADFPNGATAHEAHLRLGIQAFGNKDFSLAKTHFEWIGQNRTTMAQQTAALYWQGVTLLAEKEYDAAAKVLVDAERLDESGNIAPAAMFFSGESFRLSKEWDRADTIFANLMQQWPDSEWDDDALCRRIEIATLRKQHSAVDQLYTEFQERFENSQRLIDVNQLVARSLLLRSRFAEALTLVDQTIAFPMGEDGKAKHLNRLWYLSGLAHLGLKHSTDAIEVLRKVSHEGAPKSLVARTQLALGAAYLESNELEEAKSYFKTARAKLTGIALDRCQAYLIRCLVEADEINQALDELDHLQSSYVDDEAIFDSLSRVANALLSAKDYTRAEIRFRQLTNANKKQWKTAGFSGLGMCLYQLGKLDDAISAYDAIVDLAPQKDIAAQALLMRARCLEKLGRYEVASEAYQEMERRFPESELAAESLLFSAKLLISIGKTEQGLAAYERIVQRFPKLDSLDEVLYQWAWALIDHGQPEDADGVFSRIYLEFRTSDFWCDATYRLAEQSLHRQNLVRATKLVDAILNSRQLDEIDIGPHVLFLKARIMAEQDRWPDSTVPLQTIIAEFPEHDLTVDAQFWLAEAHYRMKDYDQAHTEFQDLLSDELLQQRPTWEPVVYLRNAQIYGQERNWTQAIRLSDSLFERFPDFAQMYEANYLVGRSYARLANFVKAREHFQKVVESDEARKTETVAMAQWMIGETYFHQKKYDNAIRAYLRGEAVYDFPSWRSKSLLQAAKCYEQLGDRQEARRLLQKIIADFADQDTAQQAQEILSATSSS